MAELITRWKENPIISPDMVKGASAVFNSGVARFGDKFVAILRVELRQGCQQMRVAWSDDGIHFDVRDEPVLVPTEEPFLTYEQAIYDPRITRIDDDYFICYAAENSFGCQVSVAKTRDFVNFEKVAIASEPTNRNMVLFPEKINGMYVRLDRPFQGGQGHIWIADSPDMVHWGNYRCLMRTRGYAWDSHKIGAGAPPFRTEAGWMNIYHGITQRCNGSIYRIGVSLLDLEDPSKVVARAKDYLFGPKELYERVGDVPNVVFVTSAIPDYDHDLVRIYYGAADTVFCYATARISELIDFCFNG